MLSYIDVYRLLIILHRQQSGAQLLLIILGMFLGIGFMVGDGNNHNYQLIYTFANQYVWGTLFIGYSVIKYFGVFHRLHAIFRYVVNFVGLWGWNYIFLSFTIFDPTPMAPTEMMLFVPVIIEIWTMLDITVKNSLLIRRHPDVQQ